MIEEISKCECPPDSPSDENDDGMIICRSCGGWVEPHWVSDYWNLLNQFKI